MYPSGNRNVVRDFLPDLPCGQSDLDSRQLILIHYTWIQLQSEFLQILVRLPAAVAATKAGDYLIRHNCMVLVLYNTLSIQLLLFTSCYHLPFDFFCRAFESIF